jgi:hypothetical protein
MSARELVCTELLFIKLSHTTTLFQDSLTALQLALLQFVASKFECASG